MYWRRAMVIIVVMDLTKPGDEPMYWRRAMVIIVVIFEVYVKR
jgi:hypothetical protein